MAATRFADGREILLAINAMGNIYFTLESAAIAGSFSNAWKRFYD